MKFALKPSGGTVSRGVSTGSGSDRVVLHHRITNAPWSLPLPVLTLYPSTSTYKNRVVPLIEIEQKPPCSETPLRSIIRLHVGGTKQ